MKPKILYAIQGEGRGHATRSLQIIDYLKNRGHQVEIFTGGDAIPLFRRRSMRISPIPVFRYGYTPDGTLSLGKTFATNFYLGLGLLCSMGKQFNKIMGRVKAMGPSVVISDFEPFSCKVANKLNIPLISINHQHFLTETDIPKPGTFKKFKSILLFQFVTRMLTRKPSQIIASSFYHFPKKKGSSALFVGPYISPKLRSYKGPAKNQVTVYLKNPGYIQQLIPHLRNLTHMQFHFFAKWEKLTSPMEEREHFSYFKIDQESFYNSLTSSMALFTTAGNQVLGEAIYLKRPILAFPEPGVVEQELNGEALNQSGYGKCLDLSEISEEVITEFIDRIPHMVKHKNWSKIGPQYDATHQTVEVIESFLNQAA